MSIDKLLNEALVNIVDGEIDSIINEGEGTEKLSDGIKLERNIDSYVHSKKYVYKEPRVVNATNTALNAIEKRFGKIEKKTSQHLGASTLPISDKWKEWGGRDGTPKTDNIVSGKKISLKFEPAQIVSPAKGDALAIFMAACEISGAKDKVTLECEKYINKYMGKETLTSPREVGDYDKMPEEEMSEDDLQNFSLVKTLQENNKLLDMKLNSLLNNNDDLKKAFFMEAISGRVKFQGTSPEGKADYVLAVSKKGDRAKVWGVKELTNAHGLNYFLEVSLKSNSQKKMGKKVGRFAYTVLRTKFGKGAKITEVAVPELGTNTEGFNIYVFEEMLNECYSQLDKLSSEKNTLNENVFSNAWNWIKDNIKTIIDYTVNFIKESFNNLIEFFDFSIDVIVEDGVEAGDLV